MPSPFGSRSHTHVLSKRELAELFVQGEGCLAVPDLAFWLVARDCVGGVWDTGCGRGMPADRVAVSRAKLGELVRVEPVVSHFDMPANLGVHASRGDYLVKCVTGVFAFSSLSRLASGRRK